MIDCLVIKVRGSQVANRPVYVAIGVNLEGERDVLGLWLGPVGGEGAKQWATMLTELRRRGLQDGLIVCCDGLKGLPESIRTTWPQATVQTGVVHMVRNSLRYSSKKHWSRITAAMRSGWQSNNATAVRGAVIHSDHGTQFTAWTFSERERKSVLLPSMGSVGDCYDNAMIEAFWSRMQVVVLETRRWKTRVELANAIFEYFEIFHNRRRRHSALGMRAIEYELIDSNNTTPVAA